MHWLWLQIATVGFIGTSGLTVAGCERSKGDAYSSYAPDSTSGVSRGPCLPYSWFVFYLGLTRLIIVRYTYLLDTYVEHAFSELRMECWRFRFTRNEMWCVTTDKNRYRYKACKTCILKGNYEDVLKRFSDWVWFTFTVMYRIVWWLLEKSFDFLQDNSILSEI